MQRATDGVSHDPISRRHLLRLPGFAAVTGALASAAWGGRALAEGVADRGGSATAGSQLDAMLRPLFRCDDAALWPMVVEIYRRCVLGRLRPPQPPFRHQWLIPGGIYVAQWIWDTMFVLDLLSILPGQVDVVRGVFQNFWDAQARWRAAKPAYMHGFIPNYIAPDGGRPPLDGTSWRRYPAFSQAPLLAWGLERVFRRNGDLQVVRDGLGPLEAFHEWYWRERDLHGQGLVCVGSYSGVVQEARYETYDQEVDLDTLAMTPHPVRKDPHGSNWYGDICIPANTAYLLASEASLIRLAALCGNPAMAARRRAKLERGVAAMRRHMWNQDRGCFLAVRRNTLRQIDTPTVGGFVPLMAAVPTPAQAQRMAQMLDSPDWATPLAIPTVARNDPNYHSAEFWRGDVWPAPDYQVASGLRHYGHTASAARIADGLIDNCLRVGINERYDSQTGAPQGVSGLGMSGVMLTMALDGLSARHRISVLRQ